MAFALSTAVAVSIVPPLGTGSTARAASDASPVKNEVNLGMSSLYTDSTSWSKSTGAKVYYGNLTDATGKSPVAYQVLSSIYFHFCIYAQKIYAFYKKLRHFYVSQLTIWLD